MNLLERFRTSLRNSRQGLREKLTKVLPWGHKVNGAFWDDLEAILIEADTGVKAATAISDHLRNELQKGGRTADLDTIQELLSERITAILSENYVPLRLEENGPQVILLVGVNGVGKTTTAAKLAYRLKQQNRRVLLVAADTFRAAAGEQLETWARRINVGVIKGAPGSDPAAVVFDALQAAKSRGLEVIIVDTAGRFHNRAGLMEELKKIKRVITRDVPGQPVETLMVLDATTGQNGIAQAEVFNQALGLTGIVLSKLDGTAKGGVALAIARELGIPVKLVGLGEKPEDLEDFSPTLFGQALCSRGDED